MSAKFDWDEIEKQTYECARCGRLIRGDEIVMRNRVVCPRCGYRVIKKVKPPIVHRIKAV